MKKVMKAIILWTVCATFAGACSAGFVRVEEARLAPPAAPAAADVAGTASRSVASGAAIPPSGYLYLRVTSNFPFLQGVDPAQPEASSVESGDVESATFVETPTRMRLLTVFLKMGSGDDSVEIPLLVYDRGNGYAYRGIGMTAATGLRYTPTSQPEFTLVARGLPESAAAGFLAMFKKLTELAQPIASLVGGAAELSVASGLISQFTEAVREEPWTDEVAVTLIDRTTDPACPRLRRLAFVLLPEDENGNVRRPDYLTATAGAQVEICANSEGLCRHDDHNRIDEAFVIFSPEARAYLDLHDVKQDLPPIGPDMTSSQIQAFDELMKTVSLTDAQRTIEVERLNWLHLLREVLDANDAVAPEVVADWAERLDGLRKGLKARTAAQRPGDEVLQLWDANSFAASVEGIGVRIERDAASRGRRAIFKALLLAYNCLDAAEKAMEDLTNADVAEENAATAEKALRALVKAVAALQAVCPEGKCWATVPPAVAGLYYVADAAGQLLNSRTTVHAAEMASLTNADAVAAQAAAAVAAAPDTVSAAEAAQEATEPLARDLAQRAERAESGAPLPPAAAAQAEDAASALALGEAVDQGYGMLALGQVNELPQTDLSSLQNAVTRAEDLFVQPSTTPGQARAAVQDVLTAIDPVQGLLEREVPIEP